MEFLARRHARFFQYCLDAIPGEYVTLDTSRMTLLFYAVSGLDLLDQLDQLLDSQRRCQLVDWIYAQQTADGGFGGGPACLGWAHVTMTYTALASLLVLGDDLSRVDRPAALAALRRLQQPDGSVLCSVAGGETDMRFVYCAAAVCHLLDDWSPLDLASTRRYVLASVRYDGGLSQAPWLESHGGSTFCGCAALSLLPGGLAAALSDGQRDTLTRWCVSRHVTGFNGRPNKPEDTCYGFWVGAALSILDAYQLVETGALINFILSTQDPITGGLAKWADHTPDPLHTYLGVSALALAGQPGLQPVHPALNISQRAAARLTHIHSRWAAS